MSMIVKLSFLACGSTSVFTFIIYKIYNSVILLYE